MRYLIKKWRQESAEWHSLGSPLVAGAYDGCARDLESALNKHEKSTADNGFRTAPARYIQQDRETIDRIRDELGDEGFTAFCLGTAMRYEDRRGAKGDPDGDAEKARWYRQMIAHVNGDGPDPRADRPGFVPYRRIGGE